MHHVLYQNNYITLLRDDEILNPFQILTDAFEGAATAEETCDELFEIFTSSVRKNYWLRHKSPLIPYRKYKKLIRLIEAGWLIGKIRPTRDTNERFLVPLTETEIDQSGEACFAKEVELKADPYRTLIHVYHHFPLYAIRHAVHQYFFQGLNPSCWIDPFFIDSYQIALMRNIDALIHVLYSIYKTEKGVTLSREELKTLRKKRRSFRSRETRYDYHTEIDYFHDYSEPEELLNAIAITNQILSTDGFWKLHDNPGNMTYYFHDFLFLLDHYWVYYRSIRGSGIDIQSKWDYPKELNRDGSEDNLWMKRPWQYLENQFVKKSIHRWRHDLDNCLEDVLSNKGKGFDRVRRHNDVLGFVARLIELNALTKYQPIETMGYETN